MSNKVLVIGDSCNDVFVYGECHRLCPDAPVPVFKPTVTKSTLGMAGNVFKNLEALGAKVHIITQREEINKTRYVHERTNQMFLRVDTGEQYIERLTLERLQLVPWSDYDAVVVSDYDKGFLTADILEYIGKNHPLTFIDTKKHLDSWIEHFTYLKINENEVETNDDFSKYSSYYLRKSQDKTIVTLGSRGAQFKGQTFSVASTEIKDTTGAGDTFLAALVHMYCEIKDLPTRDPEFNFAYEEAINTSIRYANYMATMAVQEKGTSIIKKEWMTEFDKGSW